MIRPYPPSAPTPPFPHLPLRVFSVFRGLSAFLLHDSFDFGFRVVPEVDQQAQLKAGRLEVIVDLRPVFISQFLQRFEFHDDALVADEVWFVGLRQSLSLVLQNQILLRNKWDSLFGKFAFQALLINRFQKPAPHLTVNLKNSSANPKAFFLKFKVSHFRVFRGECIAMIQAANWFNDT